MKRPAPRRPALRAACALIFTAGAAASLSAWEPPVEPPRVQQSFLTALYAPSFSLFSKSTYPLNDNFRIDGSWVNLFPKGDNLNFYFGVVHSITELPLFPPGTSETEGYNLTQQAGDAVYGKFTYAFWDYFQFNGGVEYLQNRNVARIAGYEDYDFNRLSFSEALSWDLRYSSIEKYYKGKVFLFPEEGFRLSAGLREREFFPAGESLTAGAGPSWSPQAFGDAEYLIHPDRLWVIALSGSGEANLAAGFPRVQAATSNVLGALETAGDYALDASVELRFLRPNGLFWESPEFWYVSSFLFKFSPGFILGYDAGTTGRYQDGSRIFQQSFYASPMVAIRMNGDLITVLRADFAVASSGIYTLVLSVTFRTVDEGKTTPLLQGGIH
ncbi:MAG: hypothetical protein ABSF43_08140 [Rectinemataceae bacterium]